MTIEAQEPPCRQPVGQQAWAGLLVVLFCLTLALPTAVLLTGHGKALSVTERRAPAPFPGWPTTAETLARFPDSCEQHLNDTFGLRAEMVTLNSWLRLQIGVSGASRVVVGQDGWLFLGTKVLIDDYRALKPPPQQLVDRWFNDMNHRLEFLTQHGIEMLVVVVPDKQTIYPEHMPSHITRSGNPGALDTLLALAPERAPGLQILDVRPVLISRKGEHRLYPKTDSHWNTLGAFFAYEAIVASLQPRFPSLEPLPFSAYERRERVTRGLGLSRMLGLADLQSERGYALERNFKSRVVSRIKLDNYSPVSTEVISTNLEAAPSVFVIGDSFLAMPQPYLEETFSRVVTVDRRGRGFDEELIRQYQPDILIFETVARNLFQETERD